MKRKKYNYWNKYEQLKKQNNKIMEQELKLTDEVNDILQYIIDFEYQRMSTSGQQMIDELIKIINK